MSSATVPWQRPLKEWGSSFKVVCNAANDSGGLFSAYNKMTVEENCDLDVLSRVKRVAGRTNCVCQLGVVMNSGKSWIFAASCRIVIYET